MIMRLKIKEGWEWNKIEIIYPEFFSFDIIYNMIKGYIID